LASRASFTGGAVYRNCGFIVKVEVVEWELYQGGIRMKRWKRARRISEPSAGQVGKIGGWPQWEAVIRREKIHTRTANDRTASGFGREGILSLNGYGRKHGRNGHHDVQKERKSSH